VTEQPDPVDELPVDVPAEDAAEQARPAHAADDAPVPGSVPLDVDPADLADQHREVDLDDDEYR
jgi:hypothetical protein